MEKLIRGIHKFQSDIYRDREEMFRNLVRGQNPHALFITCSDSRIVPDLICQTDPGDLFVIRNAGNLVPPYHAAAASSSGEAATIEYAVRGLGVKDIIVCGHTRCGAMQAAMDPSATDTMPCVRHWLSHADASCEIIHTQYSHLAPDARWKVMAQENVLVQIENLRTHPVVAAGLVSGEIRLHAWMYKMETGEVFTYDPSMGQYTPLVNAEGHGATTPLFRHGAAQAAHVQPALTI